MFSGIRHSPSSYKDRSTAVSSGSSHSENSITSEVSTIEDADRESLRALPVQDSRLLPAIERAHDSPGPFPETARWQNTQLEPSAPSAPLHSSLRRSDMPLEMDIAGDLRY